jgi:hypothetical protein
MRWALAGRGYRAVAGKEEEEIGEKREDPAGCDAARPRGPAGEGEPGVFGGFPEERLAERATRRLWPHPAVCCRPAGPWRRPFPSFVGISEDGVPADAGRERKRR